MVGFNYQNKVWGGSLLGLRPTYLGYLRLKYVLDDLAIVKGKVLDVGCGGGGFAKSIKTYRPDLAIFGVDINKKAIKFAGKFDAEVSFKVGDLYNLPYDSETFDAVATLDVLEHLRYPSKALKEVFRVLKPKGVLTMYVPLEGAPSSLHYWLNRFGWDAKRVYAGHIQRFSLKTLKNILKKEGFDIGRVRNDVHLLGQLVDIGFYTYLELFGKRINVGLEEKAGDNLLLKAVKDVVAFLTNIESILLSFVPGASVHITCRKAS